MKLAGLVAVKCIEKRTFKALLLKIDTKKKQEGSISKNTLVLFFFFNSDPYLDPHDITVFMFVYVFPYFLYKFIPVIVQS